MGAYEYAIGRLHAKQMAAADNYLSTPASYTEIRKNLEEIINQINKEIATILGL